MDELLVQRINTNFVFLVDSSGSFWKDFRGIHHSIYWSNVVRFQVTQLLRIVFMVIVHSKERAVETSWLCGRRLPKSVGRVFRKIDGSRSRPLCSGSNWHSPQDFACESVTSSLYDDHRNQIHDLRWSTSYTKSSKKFRGLCWLLFFDLRVVWPFVYLCLF